MRVWDVNGKEYLDAVSGGVDSKSGLCKSEVLAKTVGDQLMELCYFANGFGNIPTIRFSKEAD